MDSSSPADLLAQLDPEVWLVTAADGPCRGGMIATSVSNLSIVPELPRLALTVASSHHTWQLIEAAGHFALHRLGEERLDWVWRFGLQSGRDVDKLAGVSYRDGPAGVPILAGTIGWLACRVEAKLPLGDRSLYVGEVLEGAMESRQPALRWQQVLARATPEQRQQLKEQRERQAPLDAQRIHAWRQEHCG